jgi:hypothetical protein
MDSSWQVADKSRLILDALEPTGKSITVTLPLAVHLNAGIPP